MRDKELTVIDEDVGEVVDRSNGQVRPSADVKESAGNVCSVSSSLQTSASDRSRVAGPGKRTREPAKKPKLLQYFSLVLL